MKRFTPFALIAFLAACNSGGDSPAPYYLPPLATGLWSAPYNTANLTPASLANGGFSFDFPDCGSCPGVRAGPDPTQPSFNVSACHHVDYVMRPSMPLASSITFDATITIKTGNPIFSYTTAATNTGGAPPQITLMMEHTGDQGLYTFDWRLFSNQRIALVNGPQHIHFTAPLDAAHWGDVIAPPAGQQANTQAQFNDLLANLWRLGPVFGGGDSAGHGLCTRNGVATITATLTSP